MTPRSPAWFGAGSAIALALVAIAPAAGAAGFDTPILYSARHQGMGGTAIAGVNDPSAGFHNPAGLQGVRGLAVIGDFSLILGKVRSTPNEMTDNQESDLVVAPYFLAGAAYRLHEWFSFGVAVFPVASGGAEYHYDLGSARLEDSTKIVFIEATPFFSINVPKGLVLPGKLAFGAGYRTTFLQFDRKQVGDPTPKLLDIELRGSNFNGFRLGLQYEPLDSLKFGLVYRSKIKVDATADSGTVVGQPGTDPALEFTLPTKLGFGARYDILQFGFASDIEWAFQNQNTRAPLTGTVAGDELSVPNVFEWQNGVTTRFGIEYRLPAGPFSVPLRAGYIFDTKVANTAYPSPFGTPPAPTHTLTAGAGFQADTYQFNVAVSRRFGSTHVSESELGQGCAFCGSAGDYSLTMTGIYVDASIDLPL